MFTQLLIAILAGLGGMLGWGFADFFAKKTIDVVGDVVSLTWGHIFGTLALLIMILGRLVINRNSINLPHTISVWLILLIFGVGQAIVYFFVYKGFGKGQISILNPIFASFSGLTAILSIIIFKEALSVGLFFGLIILFVGVLLISTDFNALKSKKISFMNIPGFKEVALATIMAGLWTLFWGKFLGGQDWLVYTFLMYLFMTITIIVISRVKNLNLFLVSRPIWKFLILIGLGETLAYLSISLGYSFTTHISVIALLSGAFSLPVIILAKIFLKEKMTRTQTIGGLIIVCGIIFLSI